LSVTFVDELDGGFGWIDDSPLRRAGHALADAGRVWVFDPIAGDGVEERIRSLGEPGAVVQLLDRHDRDAAHLAARLGVPHEIVPAELPGTPFRLLVVARSRFWREVALWWPERRVLVCADAVGTVPHYFRAGNELLGVHPLLRLRPPRTLMGLEPLHVLVGHGEGVHGEGTGAALDDAIAHARRRIPRWLAGLPRLRGATRGRES
jgi:hypothetical protein